MPLQKTDGRSLRSGFVAAASRRPDALAVVIKTMPLTYEEVNVKARLWAGGILDALDRVPERVGVYGYRSEISYIGVLAALMSGAAFVPLNPRFPLDRTRGMIEAADLDAIIVDEAALPQLSELAPLLHRVPLVLFPAGEANHVAGQVIGVSALAGLKPLQELPSVLPDEVAYLLFTSGSTGKPKGVPVSHGNVLHFIDVMCRRYTISPDDRFSQTFDQTFDLSVFDLFVAWEGGACVCVPEAIELMAPTRFITRNSLTVWFSVPSVPAMMRKKGFLRPGAFPGLRLSLFCGEPLPIASAEAWQAAAPNSILENLYGPTELTIACLLHRWNAVTSRGMAVNGMVPIGRAYPGLGTIILDDDLLPVSSGPGELCVTGPQTVAGYWQDPQRTAERFIWVPTSDCTTMRFYRTGDRVVLLPSGDYAYLGRVDHQIKVLGHRVELGEVEAALRRDHRVVEAVALGWPLEEGTAQGIMAFVTGSGIDVLGLLNTLRAILPDYMVPRELRVIDVMPLNPNGKIDRGALQALLGRT